MQALNLFHPKRNLPLKAIFLFCFPIFFIFLADSVMSYMFPILVANTTQSTKMLGIIMSLSSVLGIICDFTFPQLLRNRSWRFQLTTGIVIAMLFPIFSSMGTIFSLIFFFVLATLIWGVYYEFLQFCQQSFVIREGNAHEYSREWGILFLIAEITYNIGPIVGSFLLNQHIVTSNITVNAFQVVSLLLALIVMLNLPNRKQLVVESQIQKTLDIWKELRYWKMFGEKVWPVILTGICVSFISASFWTIGGLLGVDISGENGSDWVVMVLFGMPLVLGSIILTKLHVEHRKKRISHLALLISGVLLSLIVLFKDQPLYIFAIILLSSFALSFVGPLNEAVYSDLLHRSGKSRMHLLGIAKANTSIAYIIAPLFTGFLADQTDYYFTFSAVGVLAIVMGLLLLWFSPRKVKLPQVSLKQLDGDIKH